MIMLDTNPVGFRVAPLRRAGLAAAVAALLPVTGVHAQGSASAPSEPEGPLDLVIVTATRANGGVRADLLGSSFTVVQAEDLERRQTRYVSDILRDVPGVSVSRSGSPGGLTQIRVRGTESNHTLVMIDGIEASDPFAGEFDFATLITDDVARIEVLRGQQSALYGSDAIGGVINYVTLSGREAPGGRVRVEGGSFGTTEASARYAGVAGALDYAVSAGYSNIDGFPVSRVGTRDVGTENSAASARFEYTPTETFRLTAIARYTRTEADTNDQDFDLASPTFGFVVDSDDYYKYRAVHGLVRGELDSFDGRWTNALSVQAVDASRDSFSGGAFDFGDNGQRVRYSYESTLRFGSERFSQTLTGAFDHEREKFQNLGQFLMPEQSAEHEITNKGVVVQYDARIDRRIGIGAAVRRDYNDRFDDDTTYRLQGSYRFDSGTRLRAAAGTGIKNPGIFELFGFDPGTFVGNPDLKPEKSRGWEVGVDQVLAQGAVHAGLTYFDSKLENEIDTTFLPPTFAPVVRNLETESTQQGVEVFVHARLSPAWRVDASYTYVDAEEDGMEEVRRAPHVASLNVGWRAPEDRAGVSLTVRYNGSTYDNNFTFVGPDPARLDDYTLVNVSADFRLSNNVLLYGRVENLLDERYEEVFTYRSAGRGVYAGARFTF
jgi:vitamin B12 transporter